MAHLACFVLETLRVEYRCPGTWQACHTEVIPVCSVYQAEFNTCFSFAGHGIQFPVTGDKCTSRSIRTLGQESQSRGWEKNPDTSLWEKLGVVLFIRSFDKHLSSECARSHAKWSEGDRSTSHGPCPDPALWKRTDADLLEMQRDTDQCRRFRPSALWGRNCFLQRDLRLMEEVAWG